MDFLKLLINPTIGTILFIMIVYVFGLLLVLCKFDLFDTSQIKDIIFWFITVAIILLFTVNKADDTKFFKDILIESCKWTIALEFVLNFYTFNLILELLLMPFLIILALAQAIAETDDKYSQVRKLIQNVLSIIGLILIAYTTFKTFINFKDFFTINNLLSFLLPPIMTVLLIPYLYFLALYMKYETLFLQIRLFYKDLNDIKAIKREILFHANFNLTRLNSISKNLNKFDLYQSDNIKSYIKTLTKH
jgi:hypothetical protein